VIVPVSEALKVSARVQIEAPKIIGSFPLTGGEIDDISFRNYHETVDPKSPLIRVLSPYGSEEAYFAEFGWAAAAGAGTIVPSPKTVWTADHQKLTPSQPVTLSWNNGAGLVFKRKLTVDDSYAITVTDSVENSSSAPVTLNPYGLVRRYGTPPTSGYYILHEGLVGVAGEQGLQEWNYAAIDKENLLPGNKGRGKTFKEATGGFAGITDKYWAAVIAPDQMASYVLTYSGNSGSGTVAKSYQVDMLMQPRVLAPASSTENTSTLFVCAKEDKTLAAYSDKIGI
jgi:YidC/Oxa1 family membrane protein insertase